MSEDWNQIPSLGSRREFLFRGSALLGSVALASLGRAGTASPEVGHPHRVPRARRVIWLTQAGAPSQLDLFDYKPGLGELFGQPLPESIRGGQRLTGMTSGQSTLPIAPSPFRFHQSPVSGAWFSELLPHTASVAGELCVVRSLHTEAINHDPGMTLLQTGSQQSGRPSFGSWISYGLGTENANLPCFVVLISRPSGPTNAQPLHERMWGSGFLPSTHQGVRFSPGKDPVLFLGNPPGMTAGRRRGMLDDLAALNSEKAALWNDPEIGQRIAQYELAFRMQMAVPELAELGNEPETVFDLYGPESRKPGTYASNCLLARRLVERGVRFVQLYHRGWDQHDNLPSGIRHQCHDTDQASAALIKDLRQRGLLDDTVVVWGGEFGRTVFSQGKLTRETFGRDHHPRCFSVWLAGGGIRGGQVIGETDPFSYNVVKDPVHVHDLNATLLHCLGIDHERLTFRHLGRDYRLTDVHGNVVQTIVS